VDHVQVGIFYHAPEPGDSGDQASLDSAGSNAPE
jgi:hypothetical protein